MHARLVTSVSPVLLRSLSSGMVCSFLIHWLHFLPFIVDSWFFLGVTSPSSVSTRWLSTSYQCYPPFCKPSSLDLYPLFLHCLFNTFLVFIHAWPIKCLAIGCVVTVYGHCWKSHAAHRQLTSLIIASFTARSFDFTLCLTQHIFTDLLFLGTLQSWLRVEVWKPPETWERENGFGEKRRVTLEVLGSRLGKCKCSESKVDT